jgi:hypothetical protein
MFIIIFFEVSLKEWIFERLVISIRINEERIKSKLLACPPEWRRGRGKETL